MKTRYLPWLLFSALFAAPLAGSELSRSRAELETLQRNISALQQTMDKERKRQASITSELDQVEQDLARLKKSTRNHQQRKQDLENSIVTLENKTRTLEASNADALVRLARLIKSGYAMGKQSGLRLLINQQDPDSSARRLTMFRYVMQARNRQLGEILAQTREIRQTRLLLAGHQAELDTTLANLAVNQQQLLVREKERASQLEVVRQKLSSGESTISLYQQKEQSLKKLLKELARPKPKVVAPASKVVTQPAIENQPAPGKVDVGAADPAPDARKEVYILGGFGNNRGNLSMPVKAAITAKFGQKKPESGLRWEGVLFSSKGGQPVKVVYPGQVVFADWFRGYGQLMVVDHGEGYMSLYGHNQVLQAVAGDAVSEGQIIATASDAGIVPTPGLYFEIRHNGTPDDPLKWVR